MEAPIALSAKKEILPMAVFAISSSENFLNEIDV